MPLQPKDIRQNTYRSTNLQPCDFKICSQDSHQDRNYDRNLDYLRLVAADTNPNTLLGSIEDYDPGLKRLDAIEYCKDVPEQQRREIHDRLWVDLATLFGRDNIMAGVDNGTMTDGYKFGFS
ncbi:hypothetical protein [Chamaesiphon sp.]|uniref:hypothetical protein n=1 Tax=Chamaesiphon sp. TaxID=2814140 RepID=UPI0035940A5F